MAQSGNGSNYFFYLWWALIFGVTTSVLACFFVPVASDSSADDRLDERTLYVVSVILMLPICLSIVISCPVIYKEQAQTRSSRHRFVRLILVGLIIFAVGTIAHCSIQLMADVQIRISSSNHPLDCSTYGKDGFPECNCMSSFIT